MPDFRSILAQMMAGQGYDPRLGFGVGGQYPIGNMFFSPDTNSELKISSPASTGQAQAQASAPTRQPSGQPAQPQQSNPLDLNALAAINLAGNIGSILSGQNTIMGNLGGFASDFSRNLIYQNMLKSLLGQPGANGSNVNPR